MSELHWNKYNAAADLDPFPDIRYQCPLCYKSFKEEYDKMTLEDKQEIYNIFCESNNLLYKKANSSKLEGKRILTEDQVHLVFLNEELGRPKTFSYLMKIMNIQSSNTLYCILKGLTYKDYKITYDNLNIVQKEKLATLLRN